MSSHAYYAACMCVHACVCAEEVLLDENEEAKRHSFYMVSGFEVSPDHKCEGRRRRHWRVCSTACPRHHVVCIAPSDPAAPPVTLHCAPRPRPPQAAGLGRGHHRQ